MNKSIDGTADDEDEGVPTDQAIRAGLELLKVNFLNLFVIRHLEVFAVAFAQCPERDTWPGTLGAHCGIFLERKESFICLTLLRLGSRKWIKVCQSVWQ